MNRLWQQGQCRCDCCCHFRTPLLPLVLPHSGALLPVVLPFSGMVLLSVLPLPLPPRQHSLDDRWKSVRWLTWILVLVAIGKHVGWFMVLADFRAG